MSMKATDIRNTFLEFFEKKGHEIVDSAPIVNKDDPSLLFINAGMNQFKDYFLGNRPPSSKRIADTQKCLRVSGKHNDLEEVGIDSYHHTLFEMLGNWSFGDYFKKEAINWAWELLTEVYGLPKDRLYATVFAGDDTDGLEPDVEAENLWKVWLPTDRIMRFDRKDNFWEMGDTGPCGPCSEIHIDLRSEEQRNKISGRTLVNQDHPLVIEIWNLVFIQFNRKANKSLVELPDKHVDTGMGFERLAMAIQGKTSNYDTDIFMPFIQKMEKDSGIKYTYDYSGDKKSDIAMRVVADHVRAVTIAIADGQQPNNTGAGYVIRRILRRAVRYYYSFLNIKQPYIYTLVPLLSEFFKDVFPEIKAQESFITKVIMEEERSFLNTLETGLKRFDKVVQGNKVGGKDAFELYDTYGFPIDLTLLLAKEQDIDVDIPGFELALAEQKNRSKSDAKKEVGDWIIIHDKERSSFTGYDNIEQEGVRILKHRPVQTSKGNQIHVVLSETPFYPEGGGQVGDQGLLLSGDEKIKVLDTKKENDLIIHLIDKLPTDTTKELSARVHKSKRSDTAKNHSATHLLHASLRAVLGDHVQQKGSLNNAKYLRFDFSHFQKVTSEELALIEKMVNEKIRENISLQEDRELPIEKAKEAGAMMLFGEKYGDSVRMITFDPKFSRELCGGIHVKQTGEIGLFKITAESAVAAGVRRIEALTGLGSYQYVSKHMGELQSIKSIFNNPPDILSVVQQLSDENAHMRKQMEQIQKNQANNLKGDLLATCAEREGFKLIAQQVAISDSKLIKGLSHDLEKELGSAVILLAAEVNNKPFLSLQISKELVSSRDLNANTIIRELSKHIQGGGGGQPFFATAGGKNIMGLQAAISGLNELLS